MPEPATPVKPANVEVFGPGTPLSELLASIVKRIVEDRTSVPQCRRDLIAWYNVQTPENPVEFAKEFRGSMETFKHVSEAMFSMAVELTVGVR